LPYVTIKLMEGRDEEDKEKLVEKVTEAIVTSLQVNPYNVRIELEELKEGTFAIAGKMAKKVE
jgi:4-oxalocrotonate tautomerase family enzyme